MICKKWSKRPAHSHDSTPVIFTYLCRTLNNFSHTRGHWSYCATVENKHFIYILYIRSKEQQAKIQTIKCNNKFYDFVFAVFWVYLLIVFTFQKNLRGRNKNDPDAHVWFFNHHHHAAASRHHHHHHHHSFLQCVCTLQGGPKMKLLWLFDRILDTD